MPNERNYYVICDDNCKFEGMTKEQIYDAIASATGQTPTPVDAAFITMIKDQNRGLNLKYWIGTDAEYNALSVRDANTVYIITDAATEFDDLQNQIDALPNRFLEFPIVQTLELEVPDGFEGTATGDFCSIPATDNVGNPKWLTNVDIKITGHATQDYVEAVFIIPGGSGEPYGNGDMIVGGQTDISENPIVCANLSNDVLEIRDSDGNPVTLDNNEGGEDKTIFVHGTVSRTRFV